MGIKKKASVLCCLAFVNVTMMAQSKIASGLDKATSEVTGLFDKAVNLLYAVCAIMAIIGAFHVYSKWSSGDPDVTKAAAGWIGGLIFVIVSITIIKTVFL